METTGAKPHTLRGTGHDRLRRARSRGPSQHATSPRFLLAPGRKRSPPVWEYLRTAPRTIKVSG